MSDPKGEIDPRSTYDVRYQAMTMAIEAVARDRTGDTLIETAIQIEGYLLGDNSRLAPESTEQPTQPSEEEEVELVAGLNRSPYGNSIEDINARRAGLNMPPLSAEDDARVAKPEGTPAPLPVEPMADLSGDVVSEENAQRIKAQGPLMSRFADLKDARALQPEAPNGSAETE